MKTKFNNNGTYVIGIKELNENEKLDFNKSYTFYIYHYETKKAYNKLVDFIKAGLKLEESLNENNFKEVCIGEKLPQKIDNIKMYLDIDNNKVLDVSIDKKKKIKTKKKDSNKFYLTIIENKNIDDVFFFDVEYIQTTYEFDTREELDGFINQKKRNKEPFEKVTTTLSDEKQENVVYLLENDVKKKVLEHEFILSSKDFVEHDRTIIVFWPSMDAYMVDCHEDTVFKGVCELPEISKGEMDVNDIFSAIEDNVSSGAFGKSKILKRQYIGKMTAFDFERDSEIPRCLVSNYLCANYIFYKETLEHLNKIRNLELAYNKALNDKDSAKEFLMMMNIIDEKGKVLTPFNDIIYKDDALNKDKIKTPKKSKK